MDGLAFSISSASSCFSINRSLPNLFSATRRTRTLSFRPRESRVSVFACKDKPKLDKWDLMELEFGRLLGEDPKLTVAKIMGRKLNPDASYLEIEKSFYKKKGKKSLYSDIEEVPFDVSDIVRRPSSSPTELNMVRPVRKKVIKSEGEEESKNELNLVRPVPKNGFQSEGEEKSKNELNLARPVPKKGSKFEDAEKSHAAVIKKPSQQGGKKLENSKGAIPNVILRKPSMFYDDNEDREESSSLRIEPNLSLKMWKDQKRKNFSDITLLKKPEPRLANLDSQQDAPVTDTDDVQKNSLTGVPASIEAINASKSESLESVGLALQEPGMEDNHMSGTQVLEKTDAAANESTVAELVDFNIAHSTDAQLQGKPKRVTSNTSAREAVLEDPERYVYAVESEEYPVSSALREHEVTDWTRAEDLAKNERKVEVELISSSTKGFLVSFGSLIGFLPYHNLAAKLQFISFVSWLRRKGLDPSIYDQNLGIIGNGEVSNRNSLHDSSHCPNMTTEIEKDVLPDMKLDELPRIYDQEKIKFLSSFVGQKIKVTVILVDRKSRKLIVSMRAKEKKEFVEKKRSLMAKLSIGDVVKCCIKKITYFGIFVEIEGVPALILQSEVSWDATLDPASYFKIGQIVEAKVHQLDFALERIFLSLKEITSDPLLEALECIVGDHGFLDGSLEAAHADTEWADVESLVSELQNIKGVQSVSKGRFFLSPGLAPTFQVYMASMFENQYKLLARSENKVQEVIVQATLQKEEMKSAIVACTNRVA